MYDRNDYRNHIEIWKGVEYTQVSGNVRNPEMDYDIV